MKEKKRRGKIIIKVFSKYKRDVRRCVYRGEGGGEIKERMKEGNEGATKWLEKNYLYRFEQNKKNWLLIRF